MEMHFIDKKDIMSNIEFLPTFKFSCNKNRNREAAAMEELHH